MTLEQNKALYWRYMQEIFNEGRLDSLDKFLSPSYVYQEAPPGTPAGPAGIKQVVTMFRIAFPDLKITIDEQIAEGDKVCSRTTMTGTHRGPLFGIAPTNKPVKMTGMVMVRIADGLITDSWVKNDVMSLMKQLGAIPDKK
jgi:predicted ester cyclase